MQRPTVTLDSARAPEGMRLYAVGDVHGERDAAAEILGRIRADLAARPVGAHAEIWVGDFIDRGADSAGVFDLMLTAPGTAERICLLGNHDDFLRRFIATAARDVLAIWLTNGGVAACLSWGVDPLLMDAELSEEGTRAFRDRLAAALPPAHHAFLRGLRPSAVFDDFAFVHAGIRPGLPLDAQREDDLIWIRDDFLDHRGPHGHVIVHGHTPTQAIEVTPCRIGIDTGAGKGGRLSAIAIETGTVHRLDPAGAVRIA